MSGIEVLWKAAFAVAGVRRTFMLFVGVIGS